MFQADSVTYCGEWKDVLKGLAKLLDGRMLPVCRELDNAGEKFRLAVILDCVHRPVFQKLEDPSSRKLDVSETLGPLLI
jgi:hypothetical protein